MYDRNCIQVKANIKYGESEQDENAYTVECIITAVYMDDEEELNKGFESEEEEEEETIMMKRMGLPDSFCSSKKKSRNCNGIEVESKRRVKKRREISPSTVDDEITSPEESVVEELTLEEKFNTYWIVNGDKIARASWEEKYKDYLANDEINDGSPTNEVSDNFNESAVNTDVKDYDDKWKLLWEYHYFYTYETEKEKFVEQNTKSKNRVERGVTDQVIKEVDQPELCQQLTTSSILPESDVVNISLEPFTDENQAVAQTEPPPDEVEISRADENTNSDNVPGTSYSTNRDMFHQLMQKCGSLFEPTPIPNFEELAEAFKYVPPKKQKPRKPKPVKVKFASGQDGLKQVYKLAKSLDLSYEKGESSVSPKIRAIEGEVTYTRKCLRSHIRFVKDDDIETVVSIEEQTTSDDNNDCDKSSKNGIPAKYWSQRYRLFSKYDEGIQLDKESWYSVTPEKIAEHIASQFPTTSLVIDAFCGAGGNTIHLAKRCSKVIAIDIDPEKIRMAKNNASVYGVDHLIDFVVGDYMMLAKYLRADALLLSPPWGGPGYIKKTVFDITTMPIDGFKIMEVSVDITKNIAYFLPRNTDINQLNMLSKNAGRKVKIEQNFLNQKCKTLTAYYGELTF